MPAQGAFKWNSRTFEILAARSGPAWHHERHRIFPSSRFRNARLSAARPPRSAAAASAVLLTAGLAAAGFGDCGQPLTGGPKPSASDALGVLKAAVGSTSCATCVCDASGDGKITSPDALRVLQAAVNLPVTLACLVCRNETTIGPAGGTLTARDGSVSIVFPAGAVDEPTLVSIEGAAKSDLGAALFANEGAAAWRLEPPSLELAQQATVHVAADDAVVPGAGNFGASLTLFLSKDGDTLAALADQRVHVENGQADATASLGKLALLAVIPLDVVAKVTGVPSVIDAQQTHAVTGFVTAGAGEQAVEVAEARYVDDDFGSWQPADGFAIDDELEETLEGLFGDSYDYVCTQQVNVGFSPRIETTVDVVAAVVGAPAGIPISMEMATTIQCND